MGGSGRPDHFLSPTPSTSTGGGEVGVYSVPIGIDVNVLGVSVFSGPSPPSFLTQRFSPRPVLLSLLFLFLQPCASPTGREV